MQYIIHNIRLKVRGQGGHGGGSYPIRLSKFFGTRSGVNFSNYTATTTTKTRTRTRTTALITDLKNQPPAQTTARHHPPTILITFILYYTSYHYILYHHIQRNSIYRLPGIFPGFYIDVSNPM